MDFSVKFYTIIAISHVIGLLSSYPSEYKSELDSLFKETRKNVEKAQEIANKYDESQQTNNQEM